MAGGPVPRPTPRPSSPPRLDFTAKPARQRFTALLLLGAAAVVVLLVGALGFMAIVHTLRGHGVPVSLGVPLPVPAAHQ